MACNLFRAAQGVAAVTVLIVFAAQGAAALPPRSAPSRDRTPLPQPQPDLTFRSAWLQYRGLPNAPPLHTNRVPYLHGYGACYVIANVGGAPTGPFRVAGGGLGIATNPYKDEASLAPGASRQDCLDYPTTPAPGTYKLGLEADNHHGARAKTVIPVVVFSTGGQRAPS
jgi:hypothetical protein